MDYPATPRPAADRWRPELSPLRIAAIYTVLGFLALYVFDFLLPQHLTGALLAQAQAAKGAIEIALTAGLIYLLTTYSERQLERANQRLERFASVVSHDLRNPLNTASGSLELAAETGEAAHFDRCRRALAKMERLIDDLLALAREGEIIGSTAPVELAAVAERVWQTVGTDDATLVVETDATIEADEERLEQLLGNLYRNAVEHGSPTVTVRVGDTADGFYVADDGPGVPADARTAVFDPGYSTSPGGTGLGLVIVREIARAHGWDDAVEESVDGGARFSFSGVRRDE